MEKKNKIYTLRFAAINTQTWDFIKNGKKKIETRANTIKYASAAAGDTLILSCAGKKFKKKVKKVTRFKSIGALLKVYAPESINPGIYTRVETEAIYARYPGYSEKIKEFGIIAFELE